MAATKRQHRVLRYPVAGAHGTGIPGQTHNLLLATFGTAPFCRGQAVNAIMAHQGCSKLRATSRYRALWGRYAFVAAYPKHPQSPPG